MERKYYSYQEFLEDSKELLTQIKSYEPDCIVSIARGGMCLGHILSQTLDLRDIFTINSVLYDGNEKNDRQKIFNIPELSNYNRVLVVDDIVDSGETAYAIVELLKNKYERLDIKLASLFYKETATIQPDYKVKEAKEWIDFFWEVDLRD